MYILRRLGTDMGVELGHRVGHMAPLCDSPLGNLGFETKEWFTENTKWNRISVDDL